MSKFRTAPIALAFAAAFAGSVCAQTASPRDAMRPDGDGVTGPPASPRDGQDRKDYDKDKSDADLAIERDKCGDFPEEARERCIRVARAQRDRGGPGRGTAATVRPSGASSGSSLQGGGASGAMAPAAGGMRR
jgi:hypothetical protein